MIVSEVHDGIARLCLDRPDAGNALDLALANALADAAAALAARDDVRVVLLTGAGPAFCVGGDLGYMAIEGQDPHDAVYALATALHRGMRSLEALEAPIVARVHGVAAGAGMSLVCAADLAIASASARFAVAYTAVGLSPDGGSSWLLPRIIGYRRAAELMLTNRRLDAAEALSLGLLTSVVDDDELDATVERVVMGLRDGPTPAFGAVRRLLRSAATTTFEEQLDLEAQSIAAMAATPASREGVAAFLEKRRPNFRVSS
jgi:2-(1,2-epoxy-1,2-dihydrophenyl)acetyl-CoA isomerase